VISRLGELINNNIIIIYLAHPEAYKILIKELETATRRCPGCMASTILSNWLDFRCQSKVGLFCTFGYLQLSIYLPTYMGVLIVTPGLQIGPIPGN